MGDTKMNDRYDTMALFTLIFTCYVSPSTCVFSLGRSKQWRDLLQERLLGGVACIIYSKLTTTSLS